MTYDRFEDTLVWQAAADLAAAIFDFGFLSMIRCCARHRFVELFHSHVQRAFHGEL